ncbi:MAG: lysophospholipid acyltransferase family protein [Candidatus Krumholzibacteriia bacterium]
MHWPDRIEHLAFRTSLGLLRRLPYPAAEALLRQAARLAGPVAGLRRGVVDDQLAAVYPGLDRGRRRALRDAVYDHLGRTAAEVFCADPRRLAAAVRVEPSWQVLDEAMAAGRGVIVATGHLGNFELGGRVLAARYPLLDVVKPQRNPAFDRDLDALRNRHGIATVPSGRAGRAVLAHLRRGGMVSLLVDQDAGAAGLRLDFLGRPASTWPGAARFALRRGCPVVPVAIVREGAGHVLRVGQAIAVAPGPADPVRVAALMRRISAGVEAFVGRHPEQWFWVHRRWKGADDARPAADQPREVAAWSGPASS